MIKVHPVQLVNPDQVVTKVLHLVPPGEHGCVVCGLSALRMRFHYTDDVEFWFMATAEERLGMVNPSTQLIEPFAQCTGETAHGHTH